MSSLDNYLIIKYRDMFGLDNISNISINTTLKSNVSMLSLLNISQNFINYNNISLLSNLNLNNLTQNLILTINNDLWISNNSNFINNITILSNLLCNNFTTYNNLYINDNTNLNNNTSCLSDLYINNNNTTNKINVHNVFSNNTTLSLLSDVINIGTTNSIVNITGTSLYVASSDLKIYDKILSLNINPSTYSPFDNGNLSGIEIMGTSQSGFIKSDYSGTLLTIKAPESIEQNILTLDNDNMYITGYNILNDNVSLYESLDITHNMSLKNISTFAKS